VKRETVFLTDDESPPPGNHAARRRRWLPRIQLPSLRLRISERRVLLAVTDVMLVNGALVIAFYERGHLAVNPTDLLALWKWFLTLGLVWWVYAQLFDIYNLARAAVPLHSVRNSAATVALTILSYTFIPVLSPPLQARSFHFLFALIAVLGVILWRLAYALLFVQPSFNQRALIVGAGQAGRTLVTEWRRTPGAANPFSGTGYELIGFIDDNPALYQQTVAGLPVLGSHRELLPLALHHKADEIILAITHRHAISQGLFDALLQCRESGLRLTTMAAIYERLLRRVPVCHLGADFHLVMPMADTFSERFYELGKRALDIVLALLGLVGMGVLIPIIALANRLTSPGPLFYTQERVGRAGTVFSILKFRSMHPRAEAVSGTVWAQPNDPRITPIGRYLRKTRLDELPQVINVLRGEMSIIGPRPERPEFVAKLAAELPFYRARHAVRPGITGWAQVCYRYGNSVEDARIKLEYDLYYVVHRGLLLDLTILLKTAAIILQGKGL
jgi:exopolysaccharide biosynthesis polyprenyl glycosylphosphotransferase